MSGLKVQQVLKPWNCAPEYDYLPLAKGVNCSHLPLGTSDHSVCKAMILLPTGSIGRFFANALKSTLPKCTLQTFKTVLQKQGKTLSKQCNKAGLQKQKYKRTQYRT